MTRAAIYARYSSDLQNDKSCEDQIRLCGEFGSRNGYEIVRAYNDDAISGASLFGRDGAFDLMADAQAGKFEAVIVESLDRLSRDQADLATLYKRLSFKGVKIIGVSGGVADEVQVGVRGLLGALYLKDLADKTRRGLAGKVAAGQNPGGKAYGYRPVKGEPGKLEIIEEEAEIVRRIFSEYLEGSSGRQIAAGLNRDSIKPPRGVVWNSSTIVGQASNLSGILRVTLYHGEIIWNKVRYLKDPETGRRVPRVNPQEEWRTAEAPELRIIEEKVWRAAQARLGTITRGGKGHIRRHRLLSGVIKCGACGGGMAVSGKSEGRARIICARHRDTGSCSHSRSYFLDKVEGVVGLALKELLRQPDVMNATIDAAVAERSKRIYGVTKERAKAEAEVAHAKARMDRIMARHIDGFLSLEDLKAQHPKAKAEWEAAKVALAKVEKPRARDLHAEAVEDYKQTISNLAVLLEHGAQESPAFREAIRGLLDEVIVFETKANAPMHVEIKGPLARLTGEAQNRAELIDAVLCLGKIHADLKQAGRLQP